MRVSQQIGWSQESKLYYYVLRQLEQLTGIYGKNIPTTTTTSSSTSSTSSTTTTTTTVNPSLRVIPDVPTRFDIPEYTGGSNSDFTIEWLQYMHTDADFPRIYSIGQYPAQNAVSIEGGTLYLWLNGGIVGSASLPGYLNIWSHIVITRKEGLLIAWINGTPLIAITYTNAIPSNGLDFYIGSENAPNTYYNGLISNFRWSKGEAVYGVDPPTYPTVPLDTGNTILLIGQGADLINQLTDQTATNTITATNVTYNTDSGIFGDSNGSLQFGTI